MKKRSKYYVVWEGLEPGIYDNWQDAQEQIANYPGAKYKSYNSQEEALAAYRSNPEDELRALREMVQRPVTVKSYKDNPLIDNTAIAVDASCLGNPGKMEYRGVDLMTGDEIFRVGPFEDATNNIGEYLAIVHALALTSSQGVSRTVYSDSKTALSWLRRRKANTKLAPTGRNSKVIELIERADRWLQSHEWRNKVIKWETEEWGEIPADFGRK